MLFRHIALINSFVSYILIKQLNWLFDVYVFSLIAGIWSPKLICHAFYILNEHRGLFALIET